MQSSNIQSSNCIEAQNSTAASDCQAVNIQNLIEPIEQQNNDCMAFSSSCIAIQNSTEVQYGSCAPATCDHATKANAISQASCLTFLQNCVWNGLTSCIANTSPCSLFYGTSTTCRNFNGGFNSASYSPCYSNSIFQTNCEQLQCQYAPLTYNSDAACELWWPSTYNLSYNLISNPGPNLNCVYNLIGCVPPQQCQKFIGNSQTCLQFTATDGPCKAGNNGTCTPIICQDASSTYNTDIQCQTYLPKQNCVTNGNGCISKDSINSQGCQQIRTQSACKASLLGQQQNNCSWVQGCFAEVSSCASRSTPTICINTPGQSCVWDQQGYCRNQICTDFPQNSACTSINPICTSNGVGCVTKGSCSSYTKYGQLTCENAASTDNITKCIWDQQVCRMVQCLDILSQTNTNGCNIYGLTNCITTGNGCISGYYLCSVFMTQAACIMNSDGIPCLWISTACYEFTSCTSIPFATHSQCQQIIISSLFPGQCTSDGVSCIPLTSCENYGTNLVGCQLSNQHEPCGILPEGSIGNLNPICAQFSECQLARGSTTKICQLYNPSCISNGLSCQLPSLCSSYNRYSCNINKGIDGACIWENVSIKGPALCRLKTCSDAQIENSNTDAGCAAYPGPIINSCTTNGLFCQERKKCASYTNILECNIGTDGSCYWVLENYWQCRVKLCIDLPYTNNIQCANAIIQYPAISTILNGIISTKNQTYLDCVSNGVTCILKSLCSSYTSQTACQAGGTDGDCAFTQGNTNSGTCQLITECQSADNDQSACQSMSDRCYFSSISANTPKTSCSPITCAQAAQGSRCIPVPSFNYSIYTICAPVSASNSTCVPSDGSANNQLNCYNGSLGQYTWNPTMQTCNICTQNNSTVTSSLVSPNTITSSQVYIILYIKVLFIVLV